MLEFDLDETIVIELLLKTLDSLFRLSTPF